MDLLRKSVTVLVGVNKIEDTIIINNKEFKPKAGYFIGLALIKKVYREGLISEKEYNGMVKTFIEEYKKYAAENGEVI